MTHHDLLDTEELAALLGVRPSSLRAMRAQPARHRSVDGLPEPLRFVSGRPVWLRATVDAWMASRPPQRHRGPSDAKSDPEPEPEPVAPQPVVILTDDGPWVPWPAEASRPV